ncbi:MAG TPA: YqaJ viral recombinase family protein [Isosphaeraceae bacterium]|nr:YqaJ viral recombinase family protein [Isosphaeraceae bacterium]
MAIEILADLDEVQPSSPEWLQLRKLGIGGSDAGAICGLNPRRTPYQVWAEKVNPSEPEEREESEAMRWGKLLEEPVRNEFAARTNIEVHRFPKMVRESDFPFMLANVDGLTGPSNKLTGVYEGKTTRFADQWSVNDDGSVNVPFPAMIQGMHYLAVFGLERVHFACLIGGQQLRIAEVERNDDLIGDLVEIEHAFWQRVIDREPPEVGAADVGVLKARWQAETGKTVELVPTFGAALKARAKHKAGIKQLEHAVDQIDAEIMAAMGDAEEATVNGRVVATWKSSTRWTIDTKALKEIYPDIAAEYSKSTTSRRFLPKEITTE